MRVMNEQLLEQFKGAVKAFVDETASKVKNILKNLLIIMAFKSVIRTIVFCWKQGIRYKRSYHRKLRCVKSFLIGEINKYLSFGNDIGNFMLRKADLMT